MAHRRIPAKHHRELLLALEAARTRLAVAIAAETKSTTPGRWQHYFEIAEGTRRLMKKLRNTNSEVLRPNQWTEAIDSLRRLPPHAEAADLCRLLGEILIKANADPNLLTPH